MIWTLYLCIGVTWAGCGAWQRIPFPTEEACYKSLREMKTGDQPIAESNKKRNTVAYCYPAMQEQPK
jgi:hypothetical protein